ncbi:RS10B-like protein [Mya arenaria]|uniref:RS10B-like protein n=1 Tax=Mya arenaria TaxID=6604 RepID=A0ABY7FP12_MYAAR|nr:RS10B-like protein [Mya arenaria]
MATKGDGKGKKGEKRSAKKLDDALINLGQEETSPQEESEHTEMQEMPVESTQPKAPSPEPVYDEPVLSELIVEGYTGDKERGVYHGDGGVHEKPGDWERHLSVARWKGRMDYDSEGKSYYEGDWVNNVRHGWGTRQYPSGNVYQGMWFNNVRHGEGTMKWIDRDQIYTGQWENGIQHGVGQHIWLLRRVHGSQYPLRNMYDGDFVNGLRHGFGTFYYANGAKYGGGWKNNMKHGKGKFTFKNGRIYEGMFERDHIVEYPEFTMDGTSSPDLSNIRTRTPLPMVSPSFQLDLDYLLNEFVEADRDDEASQVLFVITRHISSLRRIYSYYSSLGHEESPDNTGTTPKLAWCMSRLISDHILRYACNQPPNDAAFKMREFLYMIKDLKLINNDLTAKDVIEMCFLEFFEALIGCAERYVTEAVVKDPNTPRPSTSVTKDESLYSIPGSPSRLTSHGGLDEQSVVQGTPRDAQSPETGSPTRAVSSADGTTKTGGEGTTSKHQLLPSISNVTGAASDGGHGDAQSRHESAKDVEDELEEELDEETRQFNFWTHQIHIFFVRKLRKQRRASLAWNPELSWSNQANVNLDYTRRKIAIVFNVQMH